MLVEKAEKVELGESHPKHVQSHFLHPYPTHPLFFSMCGPNWTRACSHIIGHIPVPIGLLFDIAPTHVSNGNSATHSCTWAIFPPKRENYLIIGVNRTPWRAISEWPTHPLYIVFMTRIKNCLNLLAIPQFNNLQNLYFEFCRLLCPSESSIYSSQDWDSRRYPYLPIFGFKSDQQIPKWWLCQCGQLACRSTFFQVQSKT